MSNDYEQATAAPGEVRNAPRKNHVSDVVIEVTTPVTGTRRFIVTGSSFRFEVARDQDSVERLTIGGQISA